MAFLVLYSLFIITTARSKYLKSPTLAQHTKVHGLILEFIKPGRSTQSALIER